MKNTILASVVMLVSITASAAHIPSKVQQVAADIKANEVRTVITPVDNKNGENPCLSEGISYLIDVQVKKAYWNGLKNKVEYKWETAKTVVSEANGQKGEVCAE